MQHNPEGPKCSSMAPFVRTVPQFQPSVSGAALGTLLALLGLFALCLPVMLTVIMDCFALLGR